MKPVLILQHLSTDGPAYLGTWLARQGVRADVRDTQAGDAYPESVDGFAALAVMGGEMSANDDLPSLRQAERLILQAMNANVPVIGHCLGGQLMARALGAAIGPSPAPEIGWQRMQIAASAEAADWLGADVGERRAGEPADEIGNGLDATVFHWHAEAFALPPGAVLLATNAACPHQAFAIGPHVAMQFHVELDAAKLGVWSASQDATFLRLQGEFATVQSGPAMRAQAASALAAQQRLADRIYGRWLSGVRPQR
ncbi:GMP synthase [soil metagenome]